MNRIPDFQTDLLFSENPPAEKPEAEAAKVEASEAENATAPGDSTTATTEQPVPLAPQMTGVLEPISGAQTFVLFGFGVLAAVMLVAMTRYGSKLDYGD